jgi:hypothetical protein
VNGRELFLYRGLVCDSEANRIFGFAAWSRETVEGSCALARENRGSFLAVYRVLPFVSMVRLIVREGLHQVGDEKEWWENLGVNALEIARNLWEKTHPASVAASIVYSDSAPTKS